MRSHQYKFFDSNKRVAVTNNNILNAYDGSNLFNLKPVTQRVDMVGGTNSQNVTWNENNSIATVTHSLNCIPVVACYDENSVQVQPNVQIMNATSFALYFQANMLNKSLYCIISYGTEYGEPTVITSTLNSYIQQSALLAQATQENAESARQDAINTNALYNTISTSYESVKLGACTNLGIVWSANKALISWTDPENVILNGSTFARWQKTELWRFNSDSQYPEYPGMPGAVLIAKTEAGTAHIRDAYSTTPYEDTTIQPNTPYAYALFSYTQGGAFNTLTANRYPINTTWNANLLHGFSQAGTLLNYVSVGDLFSFEHSEYGTIPVRLMGYDDVTPWDLDTYSHAAVFQTVDCIFKNQFDAPENQYAITLDTTAQAGKAYFTLSGSTYTQLIEGTDYNVGDTIPLNSWYERNPCQGNSQYGRNRWMESDLREYLNADGVVGTWHQNKNLWEYQSAYSSMNGFLHGMESSLKNILVPIRRKLAIANVFGGGQEELSDKIFLPTIYEEFGKLNNNIMEGAKRWKWYIDHNTNQDRIKLINGTPTIHWCSSAYVGISGGAYIVNTDGSQSFNYAYGSFGVAPAYAL